MRICKMMVALIPLRASGTAQAGFDSEDLINQVLSCRQLLKNNFLLNKQKFFQKGGPMKSRFRLMKNFGTCIFGLLSALASNAAVASTGRLLRCDIAITTQGSIFRDTQQIRLPEDVFNYTNKMQSFWLPIKSSYFDKGENVARNISIVVGLSKIGLTSKLMNIRVILRNLTTGKAERITSEIEAEDNKVTLSDIFVDASKGSANLEIAPLNVECTLTPLPDSPW